MVRSRSYLVEVAAQIVLAAAIGLFVSVVLAGATMLLAGSAQAAGELTFKTSARRGGAPEEEVRSGVLKLALDHHLVSKYTSLVAVDKTPARARDELLKSAGMPTNLPEGWSYDAVYGELPRGATDARFNLLAGLLLLLSAWLLRRRFA